MFSLIKSVCPGGFIIIVHFSRKKDISASRRMPITTRLYRTKVRKMTTQQPSLIKLDVCLYKKDGLAFEEFAKFVTEEYPPKAIPTSMYAVRYLSRYI